MKAGEGPRRVGFIHTVPSTIAMVEASMRKYLPGVAWTHIYDGNLRLANFDSPPGLTPKVNLLRFANFGDQLERSGCGVIVSCCSLMPRATAFAAQVVSVPFIQLDAAILDRAVEGYGSIGVVTTTDYTRPYLEEGLNARALRLGKKIELVFAGDPAALRLFAAGELARHDEIVLEAVKELAAKGVDCVLMGQIPLALLEGKLEGLNAGMPILYAGAAAFARIGELLDEGGAWAPPP